VNNTPQNHLAQPTVADASDQLPPIIENQQSLAPPDIPVRKIRPTEIRLELRDAEHAERIKHNPPPILTLQETAALLSCSVRTVRQHINSRRISAAKFGGKVIIKRDTLLNDIDKFMQKSVG
jgi:excisionase family DNA binding protein